MPANNPTPPLEINEASPELEVEFKAPAAIEVGLEAPADTAVTTPARQELVPVFMLAMHLPSADLVAEDYTDSDSNAVRRVKEWRGPYRDVAREIENLRRNIYRRIERVWCLVREFGVWVTVTEEGVKEAEQIGQNVRARLLQLGLEEQVVSRYYVRAVKVYLEPQDAKMLLDAAVSQLSTEVQELENRIKDAEFAQNKRLVKELMYKKEYVKMLLAVFKKYIEDISR
jgi:flagellar biosynthesis regulator FlbT